MSEAVARRSGAAYLLRGYDRLVQAGPTQVGPEQVRLTQIRACEIGPTQVGEDKFRLV